MAQSYYRVDVDAATLASGVYFYRLETPHFHATHSMLVAR